MTEQGVAALTGWKVDAGARSGEGPRRGDPALPGDAGARLRLASAGQDRALRSAGDSDPKGSERACSGPVLSGGSGGSPILWDECDPSWRECLARAGRV